MRASTVRAPVGRDSEKFALQRCDELFRAKPADDVASGRVPPEWRNFASNCRWFVNQKFKENFEVDVASGTVFTRGTGRKFLVLNRHVTLRCGKRLPSRLWADPPSTGDLRFAQLR